MHDITAQQMRAVRSNIQFLEKQLEGHPVTAQRIADVVVYTFEQEEWEAVRQYCEKIQSGREYFLNMYDRCCQNRDFVSVYHIFLSLTDGMDERQRKGFYLHSYECMRQMHREMGIEQAEASMQVFELAARHTKELEAMTEEQMEQTAKILVLQTVYLKNGMSKEHLLRECEVLIMAAAVYITALQGDLPVEFQMYPETLGACMEAYRQIRKNLQEMEEKTAEQRFQAAVGVMAVLVGTSVTAFAVPVRICKKKTLRAALCGVRVRGSGGMAVCYLKPFLELQQLFGGFTGMESDTAVSWKVSQIGDFYLKHAWKKERGADTADRDLEKKEDRDVTYQKEWGSSDVDEEVCEENDRRQERVKETGR